MSGYPILVERWTGDQALTIVCERCGAEAVLAPAGLLTEGLYQCPDGCPGAAVMKYDEADRCGGCGTLGYHSPTLDHCCSRRCQLQAEYAATLKARG